MESLLLGSHSVWSQRRRTGDEVEGLTAVSFGASPGA